MQINTYLEVKFSEAINTKDSRWRTFSCSMILYKSGSVLARGSFKAVAQALVSEVMLLLYCCVVLCCVCICVFEG
jgi:hypothetical protein